MTSSIKLSKTDFGNSLSMGGGVGEGDHGKGFHPAGEGHPHPNPLPSRERGFLLSDLGQHIFSNFF